MRKLTLIFLLSLAILCNGCAFTIPWWLFIQNQPSTVSPQAEPHIADLSKPSDTAPNRAAKQENISQAFVVPEQAE